MKLSERYLSIVAAALPIDGEGATRASIHRQIAVGSPITVGHALRALCHAGRCRFVGDEMKRRYFRGEAA